MHLGSTLRLAATFSSRSAVYCVSRSYPLRSRLDRVADWLELLHPGVQEDFSETKPRAGTGAQQAFEQVDGFQTEELGEVDLSVDDLLVQLLDVLVVEGQAADEHVVERHACAPQVGLFWFVVLTRDHLVSRLYFGRRVARRPTGRLKSRFFLVDVPQAEVDELDVAFGVDQDVLRLDVSVDDACRVEVLDGGKDLPEVLAGDFFCASRLDVEELAERAVRAELEDDEEVVVLVDDLVGPGLLRRGTRCSDGRACPGSRFRASLARSLCSRRPSSCRGS